MNKLWTQKFFWHNRLLFWEVNKCLEEKKAELSEGVKGKFFWAITYEEIQTLFDFC